MFIYNSILVECMSEKIHVIIKKTSLASDLWDLGPLKRTESTQNIKDEMRKGW